ncbi:MAG: S-layer homology domain-containing protein, partial [Desulfocucumaceae bacterium]
NYSQIKTFDYTVTSNSAAPADPSASPGAGSYTAGGVSVALSCSTTGARIFYTTDGTSPVESQSRIEYTAAVQLNTATILKAVAEKDGKFSQVKTFDYTFVASAAPADPTASPGTGNYTSSSVTVYLSCSTAGARIYYTRDLTDPKESFSRVLYSSQLQLGTSTTVKAVAEKNGQYSQVKSFSYNIQSSTSQLQGQSIGNVTVRISPASFTLKKGTTRKLAPSTSPYGATVSYASSDSGVAKVSSDGTVTAVKIGKATITAAATKDNYGVGTCEVEVTVTENPVDIRITPSYLNMKTGETVQLNVTTVPATAKVTFDSNFGGIASVTPEGLVKALKKGNAKITVKATEPGYDDGTEDVTVYISEAPEPVILTDVPDSHWAHAMIAELSGKGIIGGYPSGDFMPENNITRAEFTRVLTKAINLADQAAGSTYSDVTPGAWYLGCVEAAAKAGLIKGYENGDFRPDANITRQEMAVVLVRAMGLESQAKAKGEEKTAFADDQSIAAWARGFVVTAVGQNLVGGYPDNTFGPDNNATRAEACAMIYKMLNK